MKEQAKEPHLFKRIDKALETLGVFEEVTRIRTETDVPCGVAYGIVGSSIIKHLGGGSLLSYTKEFGCPKFDGEQAPVVEEMEKLENALRSAGFLP